VINMCNNASMCFILSKYQFQLCLIKRNRSGVPKAVGYTLYLLFVTTSQKDAAAISRKSQKKHDLQI
jgi:hypothetical protein